MTNKKSLTNKIWNGTKKALTIGALSALPFLYSNNASAQTTKFSEGSEVKVESPDGGVVDAEVKVIHGIPYFDEVTENEESRLWVAETCGRTYSYGNDEPVYTKGIVLEEVPAKYEDKEGNEKQAGKIKLKSNGPLGVIGPSSAETINKSDENMGVFRLTGKGCVDELYTIEFKNKDGDDVSCFAPYLDNETINNLILPDETKNEHVATFAKMPKVDYQGVYTNQVINPNGKVSLGNAKDVTIYVVDMDESVEAYTHSDSLSKFLRVKDYPVDGKDYKQTGQVADFGDWEDKEPGKKSRDGLELDLRYMGGFETAIPTKFGNFVTLSAQTPLDEGIWGGLYANFNVSGSKINELEENVLSSERYPIGGTVYKTKESTTSTEKNTRYAYELGAQINAKFGEEKDNNMEYFFKAGALRKQVRGEKVGKTTISYDDSGTPIAEANATIDNTEKIDEGKFTPVIGVGAKYELAKNISLSGSINYFDNNVTANAGVKYTFKPGK